MWLWKFTQNSALVAFSRNCDCDIYHDIDGLEFGSFGLGVKLSWLQFITELKYEVSALKLSLFLTLWGFKNTGKKEANGKSAKLRPTSVSLKGLLKWSHSLFVVQAQWCCTCASEEMLVLTRLHGALTWSLLNKRFRGKGWLACWAFIQEHRELMKPLN